MKRDEQIRPGDFVLVMYTSERLSQYGRVLAINPWPTPECWDEKESIAHVLIGSGNTIIEVLVSTLILQSHRPALSTEEMLTHKNKVVREFAVKALEKKLLPMKEV